MAGTYTYREIADRIEAVLGTRPALSTLRAARIVTAHPPRTPTKHRITEGMPAPLPRTHPGPDLFDADAINTWLTTHPRLRLIHATDILSQQLTAGVPEDQAVQNARTAGLSWRRITAALIAHDNQPRSVWGVQKRHRGRPMPNA